MLFSVGQVQAGEQGAYQNLIFASHPPSIIERTFEGVMMFQIEESSIISDDSEKR